MEKEKLYRRLKLYVLTNINMISAVKHVITYYSIVFIRLLMNNYHKRNYYKYLINDIMEGKTNIQS